MKRYQYNLYQMISILLLAGSSLSAMNDVEDDPFELKFPKYLEEKGLPCPVYNAHIDRGAEDPILSYDLSDSSLETMAIEFQLAQIAEGKKQNDMALRIYWDLAERGYAPANNRLFEAFRDGTLGLKEDLSVASFYRARPRTIKDMEREQRSAQKCLKWREERKQEELAADVVQAPSLSLTDIEVDVVGEERQHLLSKKGFTGERTGLRQRKISTH